VARFEGKVAVVAGGATGIGAESSRRLAREGAQVVVGDVNVEKAEATAAGIVAAGGAAIAVRFDLADEASVSTLMRTAVETYGRLDLLHNNGADLSEYTAHNDTDAVNIDIELWDHVLRVDLRGYLFCCRHAIPPMLNLGGGAIVCTSSAGAFLAVPNAVAYCAAKAGVTALVRHVAARWGKLGIRSNAVAPGFVQTEAALRSMSSEATEALRAAALSPRLGETTDIAAAVAYLLSDDAAWVNGQVVHINGGTRV
jgi:NAD(P)-dependent dehydrogenase (short-subunit alcohol dehydrogenase family)